MEYRMKLNQFSYFASVNRRRYKWGQPHAKDRKVLWRKIAHATQIRKLISFIWYSFYRDSVCGFRRKSDLCPWIFSEVKLLQVKLMGKILVSPCTVNILCIDTNFCQPNKVNLTVGILHSIWPILFELYIGWIPGNFKTFVFKPKLPFSQKW